MALSPLETHVTTLWQLDIRNAHTREMEASGRLEFMIYPVMFYTTRVAVFVSGAIFRKHDFISISSMDMVCADVYYYSKLVDFHIFNSASPLAEHVFKILFRNTIDEFCGLTRVPNPCETKLSDYERYQLAHDWRHVQNMVLCDEWMYHSTIESALAPRPMLVASVLKTLRSLLSWVIVVHEYMYDWIKLRYQFNN